MRADLFLQLLYKKRFLAEDRKKREQIWRDMYTYCLKTYIRPDDTVMDIGAGYCECINAVFCKKKYAVDPNPDTKKYAVSSVEVITCNAIDIPSRLDGTIDVVICSNVLEHMPSKEHVILLLKRIYSLLSKNGKIVILQPNIDLVKTRYWDFIDHHIALNGASVLEALETSGFTTVTYVKRFLPYTTKGLLFSWYFLLPIYLRLPSFLRPYAGQSLFVAQKNSPQTHK